MRQDSAPILLGGRTYVVVVDDHGTGTYWTGEVHLGSANGLTIHTLTAASMNEARQRCVDWIHSQ